MMPDAPGTDAARDSDEPPASEGGGARTVTRLAVVGDIHHYRLFAAPWRILNKRLLGMANLWGKRRHVFDHSLLPTVLDRVRSIEPDLVLLTGDLTTTALPQEFHDVGRALDALGDTPMLAVPGNHDRYTFGAARGRLMERCLPGLVPDTFPDLRVLNDRWRLLALDASLPRIATARGHVGQAQLDIAAGMIGTMRREEGLLVMCHYPAAPRPDNKPMPWQHQLIDAADVCSLLRRCQARIIYVHGHIHLPWIQHRPLPGMDHVTDLNAGAPCMVRSPYERGQGFWQIDLPLRREEPPRFLHHVPSADETRAQSLTWRAEPAE